MKMTKLSKLRRKSYRDAYVKAHLEQGIAFQLRDIRIARGLTQGQVAKALGIKSQSAVARLEDPSYGRMSISTLLKVAAFFDVALVTKFVPYSRFLCEVENLTPTALTVPSFDEEDSRGAIENAPQFQLIREFNTTTQAPTLCWGSSWPTLTPEVARMIYPTTPNSAQVRIPIEKDDSYATHAAA